MKEIFSSVLKKKVIALILEIGKNINEIVINLELSFDDFNSIELDINNNIIIHKFDDDLDYTINFDDLEEDDKMEVYKLLFLYK